MAYNLKACGGAAGRASTTRSSRPRGASAAFTLLEVMIALAILAFLTLFVSRSLQSALLSKTRTERRLDRHSGLKNALDIMAYDISHAFNYRSIQIELHNKAQKARQERDRKNARKKKKLDPKKRNPQGQNGQKNPAPNEDEGAADGPDADASREPDQAQEPGAQEPEAQESSPSDPDKLARQYPLKKDNIVTRFIGTSDTLNFSSLSYMRSQTNEAAGDQAEIGYFLRECKGRFDKTQTSSCLWRRMSPYLDDDITQGGSETVLLENIESLELKYLGPSNGKPTWVENWNSEEKNSAGGLSDTFSCGPSQNFPQAVALRLEQNLPQLDQTESMHQVVQLRFTNNKVCKNNAQGSPQ